MVKGDKVRLNHELLIWVGFTRHGRIWTYPDGVDIDNGVPYFPEDIKACFKWLVPELYSQNYYYELLQWNTGQHKAIINKRAIEWAVPASDCVADTPALALCLAIQKLIRSK